MQEIKVSASVDNIEVVTGFVNAEQNGIKYAREDDQNIVRIRKNL